MSSSSWSPQTSWKPLAAHQAPAVSPGLRDHGGDEDQLGGVEALGDDGGGEPTERLPDDHRVARRRADGIERGGDVVLESGGGLACGQIDRNGAMPSGLEEGTTRCQYQLSPPAPGIST
jgi:hypothetical protein